MSEELTPPRFPTMLRKMWSGGEVQAWIDENWNRRAHPAAPADAAPSVAPEPVAWTLQSELDAAQTTCSAHLWFTNPRNSAWTALFTREQIAAHPPRAPLSLSEISDIVSLAQIAFCLNKKPSFEVALAREVEAAHGINAEGEKP